MSKSSYLFTSESVTEGHPDKLCDQVSDAILDAIITAEAALAQEGYPGADLAQVRAAVETMSATGFVFCTGEIRTQAKINIDAIVRDVVDSIG